MMALLPKLRWAIACAFGLAAIGVAVAMYCREQADQARAVVAQSQTVSREVQARLDSVHLERQEISDFLPRYNALRASGALGAERRLDWIERLADIRDSLQIPRLIYTISPRQPYTTLPAAGPGLGFAASRMKLDLGLVHEGDLVALIRRLGEPRMGVFEIQNCNLRRPVRAGGPAASRNTQTDAKEGNLVGGCDVDWITLIAQPAADAGTATAPAPAPGRRP